MTSGVLGIRLREEPRRRHELHDLLIVPNHDEFLASLIGGASPETSDAKQDLLLPQTFLHRTIYEKCMLVYFNRGLHYRGHLFAISTWTVDLTKILFKMK